MSYLLRVVLPDTPGALGLLATELGRVGGNIQNLRIVERTGGTAVDDILVELPSNVLVERLLTAATSVPGVSVESVHRHPGPIRVADELTLLDAMGADPEKALTLLCTGLPDLLSASWCLVASTANGIEAASVGAPTTAPHAAGLPPAEVSVDFQPGRLWPDGSIGSETQLVTAPLPGSDRTVVLARPGGPAFRTAELLKVAHLLNLAALVIRDPSQR